MRCYSCCVATSKQGLRIVSGALSKWKPRSHGTVPCSTPRGQKYAWRSVIKSACSHEPKDPSLALAWHKKKKKTCLGWRPILFLSVLLEAVRWLMMSNHQEPAADTCSKTRNRAGTLFIRKTWSNPCCMQKSNQPPAPAAHARKKAK